MIELLKCLVSQLNIVNFACEIHTKGGQNKVVEFAKGDLFLNEMENVVGDSIDLERGATVRENGCRFITDEIDKANGLQDELPFPLWA